MNLKSLGYKTDLFFPRFDGMVTDKGGYLVIQTPTNPTFYWGNFLIFAAPPQPGDFERWRQIFAQEIGEAPQVNHFAFGWDSRDGEMGHVQPFVEAGFEAFQDDVLVAEAVQPPARPNTAIAPRALQTDAEWAAALQLNALTSGYADAHMIKRMERYRAMAEAGLGAWFGAFLNDQMVASLGIFANDGAARFQDVSTHPDFRRQGICGTLVYHAAQYGLQQLQAKQLIIVADEESSPGRIYRSVGFQLQEKQVGLSWWLGMDSEAG